MTPPQVAGHGVRIGLIVLTLAAGVGAATAERTEPTQEIPDRAALSELRRLYLSEPQVVAYRVSTMAGAPEDLRSRRFDPSSDRLLTVLDQISMSIEGVAFAEGNPEMARMVDSLRYVYHENPYAFNSMRIDHLDHTSRLADGTPFLRGSKTILGLLDQDRHSYFRDPFDFDDLRLAELNEIAVKATSLPFLRGNSDLMAQLKLAEMRYKESPDSLAQERRAELNAIAMRVTGQAFVRKSNRWPVIGLIGSLTLLLAGALLISSRRKRRRRRRRLADDTPAMSVRRACVVLGVGPDYTDDDLAKAYRSVQKQYHPDLLATMGPEIRRLAEAKTREINAAYELLKGRLPAA